MPDMSIYIPHVKVLVSVTAEQLTEKTEKYIAKLIEQGVDPEMIYVSHPSITAQGKGSGYIICHTVTHHVLAK